MNEEIHKRILSNLMQNAIYVKWRGKKIMDPSQKVREFIWLALCKLDYSQYIDNDPCIDL